MNKDIIASFICCGEYLVIVESEHGTHVTESEDIQCKQIIDGLIFRLKDIVEI